MSALGRAARHTNVALLKTRTTRNTCIFPGTVASITKWPSGISSMTHVLSTRFQSLPFSLAQSMNACSANMSSWLTVLNVTQSCFCVTCSSGNESGEPLLSLTGVKRRSCPKLHGSEAHVLGATSSRSLFLRTSRSTGHDHFSNRPKLLDGAPVVARYSKSLFAFSMRMDCSMHFQIACSHSWN